MYTINGKRKIGCVNYFTLVARPKEGRRELYKTNVRKSVGYFRLCHFMLRKMFLVAELSGNFPLHYAGAGN